MKRNALLVIQIVVGLAVAAGLVRVMDSRQSSPPAQFAEDPLT